MSDTSPFSAPGSLPCFNLFPVTSHLVIICPFAPILMELVSAFCRGEGCPRRVFWSLYDPTIERGLPGILILGEILVLGNKKKESVQPLFV
ncbi:uncharacterized protein BJX67DRAFT_188629 [Aspergillus lucknowensis]|uniref:Uncharacterized protein n=1 Tax=Aspergillus lucknowensis TaxID=176173 RepID=A0ABR4LKS3_9EURO